MWGDWKEVTHLPKRKLPVSCQIDPRDDEKGANDDNGHDELSCGDVVTHHTSSCTTTHKHSVEKGLGGVNEMQACEKCNVGYGDP